MEVSLYTVLVVSSMEILMSLLIFLLQGDVIIGDLLDIIFPRYDKNIMEGLPEVVSCGHVL